MLSLMVKDRASVIMSRGIGTLLALLFPFVLLLISNLVHGEIPVAIQPLNTDAPQASGRPNFLLIVADDMGYSDLGAYGGEIHTPNLDRLADSGVKFTDFYVSPTCSPTRAMLLTGNDAHVAGLGSMAEALTPAQRGRPGYEGYLNQSVATIAERLQNSGYFTAMVGKWHLGGRPGQIPAARGFDRSFALINGAANYYGLDQGGPWSGTLFEARYFENTEPRRLPKDSYITDYITTCLIDYLRADGFGRAEPFFAYLAFTAPHTPVQAPMDVADKYRGYYEDGPQALARERLRQLEKRKLIAEQTAPHPMVDVPTWTALTNAEKEASVRRMEIYAAAVDRLDQNVGRIMDALQENGQLDNTIIIFLSDNGAEGTDEEIWLRFLESLGLPQSLAQSLRDANQDLTRVGSAESYAAYGPGWAQAVMTPFALTKGFTSEGGIRAPLIFAGPGIDSGRINRATTHVTDIVPTILDLAQIAADTQVNDRTVRAPTGLSLKPLLLGESPTESFSSRAIGWELFGRRAIRQGSWKAIYMNKPSVQSGSGSGPAHWSLYNLERDPGETRDLAAQEPAVLEDLASKWEEYVATNGVVIVPTMERRGPPTRHQATAPNGETAPHGQ